MQKYLLLFFKKEKKNSSELHGMPQSILVKVNIYEHHDENTVLMHRGILGLTTYPYSSNLSRFFKVVIPSP